MVTILVSGSGTGVGKTRVTATLASAAARAGKRVQIVKPVQTGIAPGKPSDADDAAMQAGLPRNSAYTLRRYSAALAPIAAATAAGVNMDIPELLAEIQELPQTDLRFIEGAGGLAVPLWSTGNDWWDFCVLARANAVLLVVPDQLGAINHARLVYDYYAHKRVEEFWNINPDLRRSYEKFGRTFVETVLQKAPGGVFLNALKAPPPEVATSTRAALAECHVPVWGELANDAIEPRIHQPLAELLGIA